MEIDILSVDLKTESAQKTDSTPKFYSRALKVMFYIAKFLL